MSVLQKGLTGSPTHTRLIYFCCSSSVRSQAEDTKLPKQNDDDSPDHVYHGSLLAEPMVPAAEEKRKISVKYYST